MTDYIKREDAYRRLTEYYHHTRDTQHESLRIALIGIPSADVAPVRHGRWIDTDRYGFPVVECSECGAQTGTLNFPYCFNCGARMDGDDDETDRR